MNNWERLFAMRILERGANYYFGHSVKRLNITDDKMTADVEGNDTYHVEIELDKDKIIDIHCSCPYAAKGNHCKHMVAVLYACDAKMGHVINSTQMEMKPINVDKLIECKYQIDLFAELHMEDDECIEYDEVDDYVDDLIYFIHHDIKKLIDDKEYITSFKALAYIVTCVNNIDINDLEGKIETVGNEIYQSWLEILKLSSNQEKHDLFKWMKNDFCLDYIWYMKDYVDRIMVEGFQDNEGE